MERLQSIPKRFRDCRLNFFNWQWLYSFTVFENGVAFQRITRNDFSAVMKKNFLFIFLPLLLIASGCSLFHAKKPAAATSSAAIVTPDFSLTAKVISVNTIGRFVVLNFPDGQMPQMQQTLFIYRAGLKVAEVKITGPQQDNNTVADLTSGNAQIGDVVRDQ